MKEPTRRTEDASPPGASVSDLPRRSFLKVAAGSTAAASMAVAASAQDASPIRVAVIGAGSRGTDLLRHLVDMDGVEVVALCDDYRPHLESARRVIGDAVPAFDDYEKLLDGTRPDAVIVATPLRTHFPICVDVIGCGHAVYCEKALCYSLEEARELVALVDRRNPVFQVGLQRRSNPIYDQAESMIRAGMLGTVTTIKCQWHRNASWRREVPLTPGHPDYNALDRRLNWRLYAYESRGIMAELGSHQIDVANRLLGIAPARVTGTGGTDYWRDGRDVFDTVFCTYDYDVPDAGEGRPQKVRVAYSSIQTNAYEGVSELVMGTKGTLLLTQKKGLFYSEGRTVPLATTAQGDAGVDGLSGATLRITNDPWVHRGRPMEMDTEVDDTRAHLLAFVESVRTGNRDTACTARVGLENLASVLIANEAMRSERPVAFPDDCRLPA